MSLKTITWRNNKVTIIDQTQLPRRLCFLHLTTDRQMWQAIRNLSVRGAPALGAAAALGVYLGVRDKHVLTFVEFNRVLDKAIAFIASSRPTARNLFFGLERVKQAVEANQGAPVARLKGIILKQALAIMHEDEIACRAIGRHGARLISERDSVLTICNAGMLATVDYGTALGVFYRAKEEGKQINVFACETRPILQGARLTAWELKRNGIPVTLICDNMAAQVMRQGLVKKIFVGADRIAANGDTANKIGTLALAVFARFHNIPFYVVAPASTFDMQIATGDSITIEQRPDDEITTLFLRQPVRGKAIKVHNPAFDITPHALISAIVTDKGVMQPPFEKNIKDCLNGCSLSR
ncbi:MAG: S-methyl-5-thioribose-1-phosphate isomerase [Candidatus Omnitrophica bacterium]|nr:S-methyl-5-thioribose-1-phosphate isomerase [Candidatus Omnitrophota bacterium]